jgi:DNA replication and repair protein RecF
LGFEYQAQSTQFRIAGQNVRSRLELAHYLPLLFISPESHALISEGPQQRRKFLNWGVFHVEPRFLSSWRHYQRALKQRNKALSSRGLETAWDIELARAAEQITQQRRDYIAKLEPYVQQYVQSLANLEKVSLSFAPGWRHDIDYLEALHASLPYDREYGFTRLGPHRADLLLKVGNQPAREFISRGQQKLLVIAMLLAQATLLTRETQLQPVILVDDLASELDVHHRHNLLDALFNLKAQIFLTLTEKQSLVIDENIPIRWFHVEHGRVASE